MEISDAIHLICGARTQNRAVNVTRDRGPTQLASHPRREQGRMVLDAGAELPHERRVSCHIVENCGRPIRRSVDSADGTFEPPRRGGVRAERAKG